jgi:Na+-transporting methylmalonyl-CoA/oxaloacetate decarboxylase gamma subunit
MSISEMLRQSATLTALGMAIVFAFLAFMIVCVNLVGKLVAKLAGVPLLAVEPAVVSGCGGGSVVAEAAKPTGVPLLAVEAAATEYRKKEGNNE